MKEVSLTQNKVALVDDEDFGLISRYKWCAHKNRLGYYAVTHAYVENKRGLLSMHRLIMDAKKGQLIDHKNRNGLDNRRKNLRFCTHSQNSMNKVVLHGSSKYKGVSFRKTKNQWEARIFYAKKKQFLGLFPSEELAAKAYNMVAHQLFGEYAILNEIEGGCLK